MVSHSSNDKNDGFTLDEVGDHITAILKRSEHSEIHVKRHLNDILVEESVKRKFTIK